MPLAKLLEFGIVLCACALLCLFFVLLVVKFMSLQTAVVHHVLLEKLHGDRIDVDHDGDNIKKTFIHFAWRQFVLVISSRTQWFVFSLHVVSMFITRRK